jgi:hypothetical protein
MYFNFILDGYCCLVRACCFWITLGVYVCGYSWSEEHCFLWVEACRLSLGCVGVSLVGSVTVVFSRIEMVVRAMRVLLVCGSWYGCFDFLHALPSASADSCGRLRMY